MYTIDEMASELKRRYPQYAQLSNKELVDKAIAKKPELKNMLKQKKYTVGELATELKTRYPQHSGMPDDELVKKAIAKKPELQQLIIEEKPSLIDKAKDIAGKGVGMLKRGAGAADSAIRSFVDRVEPGQREEIDAIKEKVAGTFQPEAKKEPISFDTIRNFDASASPPEPLPEGQIPLQKLSDEPRIAGMESRFLSINDPRARAIELRSMPIENGTKLLNDLPEKERGDVIMALEGLYKEDRKANAFAIGILNSTPIPTFFPKETKEEIRRIQEENPLKSAAGQLAGTIPQAMLGAKALSGILSKVPVIAKSGLFKQAIIRLTTPGVISAEQNIGRKDIKEALGDVAQQSGGGLISIIPEVLAPSGVAQIFFQPLADLIYDVAAGVYRKQDIASKDWWINEIISLASSMGFAIKDASSGKVFADAQGAQRDEIKKFLKGKGNKIELTPQQREAKITDMVREDLMANQTPARSNVIEAENPEFAREKHPSGIEVIRNIRQPPTEADLKMSVDNGMETPYIKGNEPKIEQKPNESPPAAESGRETLLPDAAPESVNSPQGEAVRSEAATSERWQYGDTKPEVESALAETSPETLDAGMTGKISSEIDRLNFQSEAMKDVNARMDEKLQSVQKAERIAAQRGSIRLPGEKKIQPPAAGGDTDVAKTLEAGRFSSLDPVEKIKASISGITKAIAKNFTKFEADVEDFPQYKDDKRTQFMSMRRNLFDMTAKYRHASLSKVYKNEGKKGVRRATDILILRNLKFRGEKGQTLENNLTVDQVSKHLDWLEKTSSPEILEAAEDMRSILKGIGQELVARGKLSAEALEEEYFPHKVLDYLPDFMKGYKTPVSRKFGEPYRSYTRKAIGSKRLIASDDSVIWTHISKVLADNAQEDWLTKQAVAYDAKPRLSPEEQKKLYKGYETVIDGKRYKALEWKKTRHKVTAVNESVLADALRGDMLVKDWLQTKGVKGGDATYQVAVQGKPELYLLPKQIAVDLDNLIEKSPPIYDLLYQVGHLTQKWKGLTLTASMLPYQMGNLIGDTAITALYDPAAFSYLPRATKIANKIFYDSNAKLSPDEQRLYDVAKSKDVASSGMSSELRFSLLGNLSDKYKTASEYRESLMRLSILAHQLDRVKAGKPVQNLAGIKLEGLDEESAAGKVAREALIDYVAVPRTYQLFLSRGLLPFVRFSEGNLRNIVRATTRNEGTHKAWRTITPIVGTYAAQWAYNNLQEDKKDLEIKLPDYIRNRWHINLGETDEGMISVWAPQQPVDMAMSWLGVDNMNRILSDLKEKRLTLKEAAMEFLGAARIGAYENVNSLLNPVIQAWEGLLTNKDPFTNKKIMPDDAHKEGAFSEFGSKYSIGYLGEKIFTPIMQFNRAKRGTKPDNHPLYDWILKGPLNIKRAFGFYEIDPSTGNISQQYKISDPINAASGYYQTIFYNILSKYGNDLRDGWDAQKKGIALTDSQQKALTAVRKLNQKAKDNGFSELEYGKWFKNTTAQLNIIDAELRKTSDKQKRKELKARKKELRNAAQAGYIKQVPKTARERYTNEMQRVNALPGKGAQQ